MSSGFFFLFSFVVRPGAKFAPKAKPKQQPRIPSSENATSSRDELAGNECQNAVALKASVPAEESMGSIHHHTQLEFPNSERGNPKQISVQGDSAASVDDSTFTASDVDVDQNSTYFSESACEVNVIFIDNFIDSILSLM